MGGFFQKLVDKTVCHFFWDLSLIFLENLGWHPTSFENDGIHSQRISNPRCEFGTPSKLFIISVPPRKLLVLNFNNYHFYEKQKIMIMKDSIE